MTTPDLATLATAAAKAQGALAAEQERRAAIAAAEAAERTARSIEWSYFTILSYPHALAAAGAEVTTALAAFRAAVTGDLNAAAAKYLEVADRMGSANRLGEDLSKARNILRTAGVILPGRTFPESTGTAAPFPFVGGPSALPPFLDMLATELDVARAAALRVPSSEDPESFTGTSTEAMKRGVLANEYHGNEELELLLALKVKHPRHFAARLTPEQRARVELYERAREASGHGGDPLPTPSIPTEWGQAAGFPTAREVAERRM